MSLVTLLWVTSLTIFRMDESKYRNSKQLCDYCFRHINETNCIAVPVSQSLLLFCYDDTSLMCAPLAARHTKRQSTSCNTYRRFRSDNVDLCSWFYLSVPPHWLDLLNGWHPWQNLKIKSIWDRIERSGRSRTWPSSSSPVLSNAHPTSQYTKRK
jgi:hypothetical protein